MCKLCDSFVACAHSTGIPTALFNSDALATQPHSPGTAPCCSQLDSAYDKTSQTTSLQQSAHAVRLRAHGTAATAQHPEYKRGAASLHKSRSATSTFISCALFSCMSSTRLYFSLDGTATPLPVIDAQSAASQLVWLLPLTGDSCSTCVPP